MGTRNRKEIQAATAEHADRLLEMRALVEQEMRGAALALAHGLFLQEVEELCGAPFSRKDAGGHYRGGSDPGSVMLAGQRLKVKKARVKRLGARTWN